jgi:hypothetical protein
LAGDYQSYGCQEKQQDYGQDGYVVHKRHRFHLSKNKVKEVSRKRRNPSRKCQELKSNLPSPRGGHILARLSDITKEAFVTWEYYGL